MSGNEALGKQPTVEEEMAKFKGFSVVDGEVSDGKSTSAAEASAAAEETERRAAEVNGRSHQDNQKAGTTSVKNADATAKVELSADEEQDALQEATDKKGAVLTDEEADAVVEKALAAKEKAASKPQPDPDKAKKAFERREARRRDNLARENEDLRRRLENLERGGKAAPLTVDNKGDKKGATDGRPDPTDAKYQYGELDAKYIADLARYETLQAIAEREEGNKNKQKSEQEAQAEAAFKEAKAAFEEAGLSQFDDFEQVVMETSNLPNTDPDHWPLSAAMGELILESDHGPAIAYQLASDPKEARRIFQLSPARQAAWFGVTEAKLSAGSAKATDKGEGKGTTLQAEAGTKRVLPQPRTSQVRESKAPLPLSKVAGAGGNRVPSSATTDFAAFEALAMGAKR